MAAADDWPVSLWRRWTDRGAVPFHRFCELVPVVRDADGGVGLNRERPAAGSDEPAVRYATGTVRVALRFTPLIVVFALAGYVLVTELSADAVALSALLPSGVTPSPLFVAGLVVWLGLLVIPLQAADIRPSAGVPRAVAVYGTLLVLLAGVAVVVLGSPAVDLLSVPAAVAGPEWTILNPVGLLAVLLVGGTVLYDTVLRLETTLTHLPEKRPAVVDSPAAEDGRTYGDFLADLQDALRSVLFDVDVLGRRLVLPTRHVFALVFVLPLLWSRLAAVAGHGGIGALLVDRPVQVLVALVPYVLDFLLVVLVFQFLVITAAVYRLFAPDPPPDRFALSYAPDHPDGAAGFHEFGAYAARVNLLLVLAGLYVVYRIYALGLPLLEGSGGLAGAATADWAVLFLGPLAVYVVAALLWLYLSFWRMHRYMERGRRQAVRRAARSDTEPDLDAVERAPVWPIDTRHLAGAITLDLLPVLTLVPIT